MFAKDLVYKEEIMMQFTDICVCKNGDKKLSKIQDFFDFELSTSILCFETDVVKNITGFKILNTKNLKNCFTMPKEYAMGGWTIDIYNDLRAIYVQPNTQIDYFFFRRWKSDVSEQQKKNFYTKAYNGQITSADLTRLTQSLGPDIFTNIVDVWKNWISSAS
jgi:hypothetical protein